MPHFRKTATWGDVQSPALVRLGWFEWCLPPLPIPQLSGEQKLLGGKLQTGFVGFSYNLMLRIESNSKVVVDAHLLNTEDFSPDFRQHLLDRGVRQNLTTRI